MHVFLTISPLQLRVISDTMKRQLFISGPLLKSSAKISTRHGPSHVTENYQKVVKYCLPMPRSHDARLFVSLRSPRPWPRVTFFSPCHFRSLSSGSLREVTKEQSWRWKASQSQTQRCGNEWLAKSGSSDTESTQILRHCHHLS